uniref:Coiled-coil domain-containing protein n=1 Tax=Wuchereria bancrofti TaxID=6293 RepID=A0AAF5Q6A5_WUCBA
MKNGELPRRNGNRCSDALDEMLEIRSKKGNVTQKVELSKQTQLMKRPITRHGRYGETIIAAPTSETFPLSFKPSIINTRLPKSDVVVERWQREGEEEEGSGGEMEEEEQSNSDRSDANETESKSREEILKVEAINDKCGNDAVAIAQEIRYPPAVSTAESKNHGRHSIGVSNEQNSSQAITTVRWKNLSSAVVPNSLAIEKTAERQVSQDDLCDTFRMQSIYTISRNKTDSRLRKPVEKHSRTTALGGSSSSGKEAYEEWFRKKLIQEREKRRKQKEKEEDERKAREERRKEAERNYEIWKQRSDEAIREKRRTKKEKEETLAREKMEEMRRKKEEATQMFQVWKNERLQRLTKERKQRMQNKENDELKKKHEMEIRNKRAQKAFNAWYEENKIRNAEAQRKLLKSRKTEEMQSRNTKEYKEALAREAYDVWLQIKENERLFNESLQGRIMKFDEMSRRSHLIPWIPPSNVIPRQFISTGTRRHQSVKRSIKPNQTYKMFPSAVHRSKSALR